MWILYHSVSEFLPFFLVYVLILQDDHHIFCMVVESPNLDEVEGLYL